MNKPADIYMSTNKNIINENILRLTSVSPIAVNFLRTLVAFIILISLDDDLKNKPTYFTLYEVKVGIIINKSINELCDIKY